MSNYAKALGEVVYRERKAQKITQAQLAELVGTTEQTIRKIEHGNSNIQMSVLFPLLRALHIDPVEVFYPEAAQERSAKEGNVEAVRSSFSSVMETATKTAEYFVTSFSA